MKVYAGRRTPDGTLKVSIIDGASKKKVRPLPLRLDIDNHSPTGFECGYEGSGPAQLALAILADCLGDAERAFHLHQRYKRRVIAGLTRDGAFHITERQVLDIVNDLEAKKDGVVV